MRALVLADVHYDPLYDAHARPDCMCRSECANASATPLAFGQPGCDSPSALLDSTLSAAAGVLPRRRNLRRSLLAHLAGPKPKPTPKLQPSPT